MPDRVFPPPGKETPDAVVGAQVMDDTTTPDSTPAASVLSARPGAVRLGSAVALHHGDPMREQRLLEEGLAVVDLSDRGVVTVTGPDRLSWLHSLLTQQVGDLAPGQSAERSISISNPGSEPTRLSMTEHGERVKAATNAATLGELQ